MRKETWQNLAYGIKYKEQNYGASCFAAAFQNLEANMTYWRCLGRSNQYCYYEDLLNEFQISNNRDSLDLAAPSPTDLSNFATQHINGRLTHLEFGTKITRTNIMSFAGVYNKALIFSDRSTLGAGHASAFFCKSIRGVDHFVCLSTITGYTTANVDIYAAPCDLQYDIFDKFTAMAPFKTLAIANTPQPIIDVTLVSFT